MSTAMMASVWPLQMPPTPKAVLVSLADNSNDSGYCWPSIDTIATRTCFSKRAVIDAIKWLESNGYLTADRSNGRHTTYQLTVKESLQTGAVNAPVRESNRCSSRTKPVHLAPKPVREVHSNRQEPSITVIKNNIAHELPEDIPAQVWAMWDEYRKRKSGKGWTEHAQKLAMRSLVNFAKAGHDIQAIVETSIERGYTGLFEPKNGERHANRSTSRPSLVDRVAEKLRAEVLAAERVGPVHPAHDADLRPCMGQ